MSGQPEVGYVELLRGNIQFRNLYIARLVSLLGDWFNLIAILALLRSIGADSASAFGGALIVKALPSVVVTPWAGDLADRFSRKGIMLMSDVLRAFVVFGLFIVLWYPSVPLVYALMVLQAALAGFFEPARSALLPDIVKPEELTAANALGAATWSAMLTIGTALGGIFTAFLGWKLALVVDIGSYLLSAWFLLRVIEPPLPEHPKSTKGMSAYGEGLRFMIQRPAIWTMATVKVGWNCVGAVTLMLTILGERQYTIAENAIMGASFFYMMRGLGTGIGPIVSRYLSGSDPVKMERMIGWSFVWAALCYNTVPWLGNAMWVGIAILLAHLGGATVWVFSTIRLQQLTPTAYRGRVFATEQACFLIFFVLTNMGYGHVVDQGWLQADAALAVMGSTLLLPAFLWFIRQKTVSAIDLDPVKSRSDRLPSK